MASIRWLHLTDHHQGVGRDWLWPSLQDQFYEDLARLSDKAGPWDVVLFTGDLTQRASESDFAGLDATLDGLLAKLAELGSHPAFLAVPGNHDLVRPKSSGTLKAMSLWHTEGETVAEDFWAQAPDENEYRLLVKNAFKRFGDWYERRTAQQRPQGVTVKQTPGPLPGDFAATIEKEGIRLGVVGLNTAFLQLTDGSYKGKLDLDPRQFGACGPNPPAWIKSHHAALLLTHHPLDWLHPNALAELQDYLYPGFFAAHLAGHMHESVSTSIGVAGLPQQRFHQASSLFGLEWIDGKVSREHGYTAGQIEISTDGTSADLRLWPRRRSTVGGAWKKLRADTNYDLDERESIAWPFKPHPVPVVRRSIKPTGGESDDIPQPRGSYDANFYVAREDSLKTALRYLSRAGKPTILWGPEAIGKTWFLKHLLYRKRAEQNAVVVEIDLRKSGSLGFEDLLQSIGLRIARGFGLPRRAFDEAWRGESLASDKLEFLLADRFLANADRPLVLALDSADAIEDPNVRRSLAALLRGWADQGADHPWSLLRIVVAASTKALTNSTDQSVFHGLNEPIELKDFSTAQLLELARKHRIDWQETELRELARWVDGHPYLASLAMFAARHRNQLEGAASGPRPALAELLVEDAPTFEPHLQRCRSALLEDERLRAGLLARAGETPAPVAMTCAGWSLAWVQHELRSLPSGTAGPLFTSIAEALLRLGVVVGAGTSRYRLRYRLYERL
jgi:hypothetical protein